MYVHMYIFCVDVSFEFLHTIIYQVFLSNTNNLHTVVWFQVFLYNVDDHMVSSKYFYLIVDICLHTVIGVQSQVGSYERLKNAT